MTGASHDLTAVATAILAGEALALEPPQKAVLILGAYLTARLPDRMEVGGMDHRGITHWASTGLLVAVATFLAVDWLAPGWGMVAAGAMVIGYGTHLAFDAMTVSGIPAFGPFYLEDVHALPPGWRFRTGSLPEAVFRGVVVVGLASYMALTYLPNVLTRL